MFRPPLARVVAGAGLAALASIAPPAPAAMLPTHPIDVTVAKCDVSARATFNKRAFQATVDHARCDGVISSHVVAQEVQAEVTGKAAPAGLCRWTIRQGRLTIKTTVPGLPGGRLAITVPFRTERGAPAAPFSGTATVGHGEAVGYRGVASLVPNFTAAKAPPRCSGATRAARLSLELSLTAPQEQ